MGEKRSWKEAVEIVEGAFQPLGCKVDQHRSDHEYRVLFRVERIKQPLEIDRFQYSDANRLSKILEQLRGKVERTLDIKLHAWTCPGLENSDAT